LDLSGNRLDDNHGDIIIAIYSTGIKVTNRGPSVDTRIEMTD